MVVVKLGWIGLPLVCTDHIKIRMFTPRLYKAHEFQFEHTSYSYRPYKIKNTHIKYM